jgi:hypothetical protein
MMKEYKRAFAPNPNYRFDPDDLQRVAPEIVYVCHRPMFDNLMGEEHIHHYEHSVAERMKDFDPETDVIAYYGDSMIFALMIMWLSEHFDTFDIARFSSKEKTYLIRTMSFSRFPIAA